MADIKVAFINESTVVTDKEVKIVMNALQVQVRRDFSDVWGIDADLAFYSNKERAPDDHWWIVILDRPDFAGAYGYHELTPKGLPLGKVFPKLDMDDGNPWSTTASHELLEMLADPGVNLMVCRNSGRHGNVLYAYEVCDPCQNIKYSYKIGGVPVSNFVYPSWFEQISHPKGTKFDHLGKIREPFQLLPEGYINIYRLNANKGWEEKSGRGLRKAKLKKHAHTRRARRKTGRESWKQSDSRKIAKRRG